MRKPTGLVVVVLGFLCVSFAAAEDRRGPYTHPPRSIRSRDVHQQHLRLELSVDLDKETFHGRAVHIMSPLKPIRAVQLDAADMKIEKVSIGEGANASKQRELKFETRSNVLEISLDREYAAGETFTLTVDYRVDHPTKGAHFVVPDESEPSRSRSFWTQGEPEDARFWFPCIDSPSDRLTSEVLVTVPKKYFVLSNGVQRDKTENADGTHTFHWVQEQSLATYLVSVVVGEFDAYEQKWDGIPITSYVPKGRLPDAERSFKKTASMVEYFSKQIGVRYPWPKYAQICADDFGGGMENTSATTLPAETLHDERADLDVSSDNDNLIAHELAHQWWGDLVTAKDWAEIWLNESFATYFATLWTEHDLGMDEATWARHKEAEIYLSLDKDLYRRPIVSYTYDEPWGMFDSESYQKGGRVLHMLRFVLGDELFWKSLRHYAEKHRLGTVEAADLRIAIEEATGQGLNWFFDEWLNHAGHPEFTVSWRWDDATKTVLVTVKQTQQVDNATPLFETPVEIEVATRNSTVVRRVNVSHATETFHFSMDSQPTRVCFDPRDWILKKLSFDKSKEELLDQLAHDDHVMCRIEAIEGLSQFPDLEDADVLEALAKASRADSFWAVRQEAVKALGKFSGDKPRDSLIEVALHEVKSTVRIAAIEALASFKHDTTRAALRAVIQQDRSYFAVAAALRTLVKVDRDGCRADLLAALGVPSHREAILQAASEGLVDLKDLSAVPVLLALENQPSSALRRVIVIGALARLKSDDASIVARLDKELDNSRPMVRGSAVDALVKLGDPRAIELLVARRAKEKRYGRLSRAIDKALVTLRQTGDNRCVDQTSGIAPCPKPAIGRARQKAGRVD